MNDDILRMISNQCDELVILTQQLRCPRSSLHTRKLVIDGGGELILNVIVHNVEHFPLTIIFVASGSPQM